VCLYMVSQLLAPLRLQVLEQVNSAKNLGRAKRCISARSVRAPPMFREKIH
jgi:hypothetical protein